VVLLELKEKFLSFVVRKNIDVQWSWANLVEAEIFIVG
jgi:hypothetical protein